MGEGSRRRFLAEVYGRLPSQSWRIVLQPGLLAGEVRRTRLSKAAGGISVLLFESDSGDGGRHVPTNLCLGVVYKPLGDSCLESGRDYGGRRSP